MSIEKQLKQELNAVVMLHNRNELLLAKLHRAKEIIGARHADLSEIEKKFFDELGELLK